MKMNLKVTRMRLNRVIALTAPHNAFKSNTFTTFLLVAIETVSLAIWQSVTGGYILTEY